MPLPGPIGLPCALNYTLNNASLCVFDASTIESTNLQCPQYSTLIGQKCIGSCSASFIPSPTLGCVTNPNLRENYRVPNVTTSCPSGKTLRTLLSPPELAGKFCVPSSYYPVDSLPFCPVGCIQSDNRCYKSCPSSSDFISNPPLCYAIYGDQYNPLPQPVIAPNPINVSSSPPSLPTTPPPSISSPTINISETPSSTTSTIITTPTPMPQPAPQTTTSTLSNSPMNVSLSLPSTATPSAILSSFNVSSSPLSTISVSPILAPTTTTATTLTFSDYTNTVASPTISLPRTINVSASPQSTIKSVASFPTNIQINAFITIILILVLYRLLKSI